MAKACNNYNWHLPGRLQMDAKPKKLTLSLEHLCQYSEKDKQKKAGWLNLGSLPIMPSSFAERLDAPET